MSTRMDLISFMIKESTGMDVKTFLNTFRKLPANSKKNLINDEQISDALRMLNAGDNKFDNTVRILIEPDQRIKRAALRKHYMENEGLNSYIDDLVELIKESDDAFKIKQDLAKPGQRVVRPTPAYSDAQMRIFSKMYKTNNPFLMTHIKNRIGESRFAGLQRKATSRGFLQPEDKKFYTNLFNKGYLSIGYYAKDEAVTRAANILKRYKELVPTSIGSELRGGPFAFSGVDIMELLKTDDFLKAYLTKPKLKKGEASAEYLKSIGAKTMSPEKYESFVKNELMKQLKREGILDELGLQNLDLLGFTPKLQITDDPKIKNFMIEEAKKGNAHLINSNMVTVLNPDQKQYFDNFITQVREKVYSTGADTTPLMRQYNKNASNHAARTADLIRSNFNRFMRYSIFKGETADQAFDNFKKQVESEDFFEKAIPIIYRTAKLHDKINYNKLRYGIEFPKVSLSHHKAAIDYVDLTFKSNNLFTGERKLNAIESGLQQKIRNLKSKIDQRGGKKLVMSDETIRALQREIDDLEYELEISGVYEPVAPDYEKQIDQAVTDISTAGSFLFKDGGFASIEDVLDYRNG